MALRFEFDADLWRWEAQTQSSWFFVSLPEDATDQIDETIPDKAGFGSVPVEVTIGGSTWKTSVFPDAKRGTFVLPVKKAVRTKERLAEGRPAHVELTVVT